MGGHCFTSGLCDVEGTKWGPLPRHRAKRKHQASTWVPKSESLLEEGGRHKMEKHLRGRDTVTKLYKSVAEQAAWARGRAAGVVALVAFGSTSA